MSRNDKTNRKRIGDALNAAFVHRSLTTKERKISTSEVEVEQQKPPKDSNVYLMITIDINEYMKS